MALPKVMLAGPTNECWKPVEDALRRKQKYGTFKLEAWDVEAHRGSTETIRKWREKTKDVDAIIFIFGKRKDNGYGPVNSGTIISTGQAIGGEIASYDTTATEQEFLHCFLRPVPHKFLIPNVPKTRDPFLRRMIGWANKAIGTVPSNFANCKDAARQASDFVESALRDIESRSKSRSQSIPGLSQPHVHSLGLKNPTKILRVAPPHVRVALEELANSLVARRGASRELVEMARLAVSRAVSIGLTPPGSEELEVDEFFDKLATWAKTGPGLADTRNFLKYFFSSLSVWERALLLHAACEAGLVHRYFRRHAEELRIHEIIIPATSEIPRTPRGTFDSAGRIQIWAISRWKEVFAAGAVYAGHPQVIKSALLTDWEENLEKIMSTVDNWGILREKRGNWKLRWNQLVGVVRASEGEASWKNACKHLDEAIRLARLIKGNQLVHSLVFRLWVTKDPRKRRSLQAEIDSLSKDPNRSPDSFRRLLYKEHRNSLWGEVFSPVKRKPL